MIATHSGRLENSSSLRTERSPVSTTETSRLENSSKISKYRGDLSTGSIERCISSGPVERVVHHWSAVPARDDLIGYHTDDVRRAALAVLADFTGDAWKALVLHNLFVHYWKLDVSPAETGPEDVSQKSQNCDTWRLQTGHIDKWVEKKLRKLVGTPRYIAPPKVWEAIERLHLVDADKFPRLPATANPELVGVRRGEKKKRRRKEAVT